MTPILPTSTPTQRGRYRAPSGLPKGREDWRVGSIVSLVVHLGIILLLITPAAIMGDVSEIAQGAGGPGPTGGGGGGRRGSGSLRTEMLRFVRVAPTPPPVPPAIVEEPKPEVPKLELPKIDLAVPPVAEIRAPEPMTLPGVGGGTGADNAGGTGPGTGGGIGTGSGTGKGSATGAGTGGGAQANYPPTPTEIFIPPLPVPASVKGHHLIAEFDVDETGKVLSMKFNETRDRGYNRRLAEVLREFRFRPGTTPAGKPIRMTAQVIVDLY